MISLILAVSENGVIGDSTKPHGIPWDLPDDMKHFRDITRGKTVIMGSKTFEHIGRPLPKRRNIVISRNFDYQAEGCEIAHSPEEALEMAQHDGEIMIIGGAKIYEAFLPIADRIYLTRVHAHIDGDTLLTLNDANGQWRTISATHHPADIQHKYSFDIRILEQIV